jgi:hypothetical protein
VFIVPFALPLVFLFRNLRGEKVGHAEGLQTPEA